MASCAFPTGDSWDVRLDVVRDSTLDGDPAKKVWFSLANMSDNAHWIPACDGVPTVAVDRLGTQWQQHAGAFCLANVSQAPIVLEPGDQMAGEIVVRGTGLFRLHTGQTRDPQRAMTWNVTSEPFEIPD